MASDAARHDNSKESSEAQEKNNKIEKTELLSEEQKKSKRESADMAEPKKQSRAKNEKEQIFETKQMQPSSKTGIKRKTTRRKSVKIRNLQKKFSGSEKAVSECKPGDVDSNTKEVAVKIKKKKRRKSVRIAELQKCISQKKDVESQRVELEQHGLSIADRRAFFERGAKEPTSREAYSTFNRASAESKTRKTQTRQEFPMVTMIKDKTNEVDERAGDREVVVSDVPAIGVYDLSSAMDGCLDKVLNNLCGTDGDLEVVETKSESEDGDSDSVHEVDMNGLDHLGLWPEQKAIGANQEQQVLTSAPPDQDSKTEEQVPNAAIEIGTATANEEQTPETEETTPSPEANETETNPPRTPAAELQSTKNTSNTHEETAVVKDVITTEPTLEQTLSIGSHEVDAKTEEQVPTEEAGENTSKQTFATSDLTKEAEQKIEVYPAPADHSADSPDDTKAAEQEKNDTKTEEQVETKTEEQVDTDTEEQAEIESAEKAESKTEEQVEAKTEEQVETEVEEQADIETEEQAEIDTAVEVDTKTEEQVETETEEQADIETEDQVDTKTEEKVPIPVQDVLRPKEMQPVNEAKTEEQVPPPWPIQKQTTEPDGSAEGSQSTEKQQPKQNKDTLFPDQKLVEEEDEDQDPLSVMVASQHELPAAEEAQEAMAKVTKELEILSLKESEERQRALQNQLEREKKIAARRERVQKYVEQDRERKALRKQLREATAMARREWIEKEKERKRELNERRAKQLVEDEIKYKRHIAKIKHKQEKAKSDWKPVQKTPRGFSSSARKEYSPESLRFADRVRVFEQRTVALARAGLVQPDGRPFPNTSPPNQRVTKRRGRVGFGSGSKRDLPW